MACTPVETIPEFIAEAARHAPAECYLTDAGSTKVMIVGKTEALLHQRQAGPLRFIGGHPIAGSEKTGAEAASSRLFRKRICIITPTASTDDGAVAAVEHFWRLLGAKVVRMSPAAHDLALAHTSHLPHLVASTLAAATPADMLPLIGTGWSSTTRVAAGDVELWQQILLSNSVHTLNALDRFETVIARLRQALEKRDGRVLAQLGVSSREALRGSIRGVTGTADALFVMVNSIDVNGAKAGPIRVVAHDVELGQGEGLLGRDYLDRFIVNIDNQVGIVTLTPR